jgi:hypothetical protein
MAKRFISALGRKDKGGLSSMIQRDHEGRMSTKDAARYRSVQKKKKGVCARDRK